MENLTPPAAGQKRTGWSTASAGRATLERCQLEPLRPDQCQRQQPGTGTGSRPTPPTICTGTHPAQQITPPVQTEGQSSSAPRAAALAFFFCRAFTRLPPARPAGSAARRALGVAAAATMTTPAPRSRSRSHRPPPAPGRISTASAAPDAHASSRPPPPDDHAPAPALPHLHSAHSLPALPDLTAAAQPPAPPPRRTSPPAPPTCRRLHRCRLPDDPPRSTPQNGHFAPPPEGSDSPPNGIEL